ncbi:hypothetical protein LRAMOSA07628 [Lichtheimia ramosa]|uniref:Uncharacterized protein n=1 Tax=Lichtheimia ramosa TaxID=688394 RepID=A0A077WD72_9FUNG|nr:hypothetical protein LRAMOSA07628 [Lichtheimia ramosa]
MARDGWLYNGAPFQLHLSNKYARSTHDLTFTSTQHVALVASMQDPKSVLCTLFPPVHKESSQHVFALYLLGKLIRYALSMLEDGISGSKKTWFEEVAHCFTGLPKQYCYSMNFPVEQQWHTIRWQEGVQASLMHKGLFRLWLSGSRETIKALLVLWAS